MYRTIILSSLAAASASIFLGASVAATRFVVHAIDPLLLAFLRYGLAALCLAPVLLLTSWPRPGARDLTAIAALGIIFFGLSQWFFSAGLQYIPSARGALWVATMPFLTFGLAALLRFEPVTWPKTLGMALATIGVVVALKPSATTGSSDEAWFGDLLLLGTACCGAVYNVLSRPILKRLPSLPVTCLSIAFGAAFLGVLSAARGVLYVPALATGQWLAVVFLGTFGAAIAIFLWVWALRHSTPARAAVFLTLNPLAAMALGIAILDEPVEPTFIFGLVLVLVGIVLANVPRRSG